MDNECYQKTYLTSQGERWDQIALAFYGNALKLSALMAANPQFRDVMIFPAGCELKIPILEEETATSLPPWKR